MNNINNAEQDNIQGKTIPFEIVSEQSIMIPVIEEQMVVDKQLVETGKVIISKKVNEEAVNIDVQLSNEKVNVERIEINQYVETTPEAIRYEGETMIISILKEVYEKRIILMEELHVTKIKNVETVSRQETLRREEINIERSGK